LEKVGKPLKKKDEGDYIMVTGNAANWRSWLHWLEKLEMYHEWMAGIL